MAQVLVKAKSLGYYNHKRVREGQEFEIEDKLLKYKDGKLVAPKWVEIVGDGGKVKSSRPAKASKVVEPTGDEDVI